MRGHIRRRGRSWELKYDVRTDGLRRTVYRAFKGTRREAQAELARLLAQVADGGHVEPSKLTVAEHVRARFEQWQASGAISPKTAEGYAGLIERHIVPYLGNKLLQKINTRDVEAWHSTLLTSGRKGRYGRPDGQAGVSTRTIGHAHRVLSKALREGMRHELVLKNVAAIQRAPKVTTDKMVILTPERVAELPARLDGHALAAPAVVALFTGMRRGEILALRWGNVDVAGKVIRVRESLEATKAGLRFKPPKSKAGVRDVTLPAIVVETLQAHRKTLLERRLMLGQGKLADADLVFPAWDGSPQHPDAFGSMWIKLATQLGLGVSFHGLRHTHASQLIDAGVDVVTIARRLGHSSPAITLNVYAHLFRKDDGKAAAIDAALGSDATHREVEEASVTRQRQSIR
jgi:integrase